MSLATSTAEGFPEYPPRSAVPFLGLDESMNHESINVGEVVDNWMAAFIDAISRKDFLAFENLFVEESWWRDLVALTWDTTSKYGPSSIGAYVLGSTSGLDQITVIQTPALSPRLAQMGPATFIQLAFSFTTRFGSGRGMVRLANIGPNQWKAWTASTELESLKEGPETDGYVNVHQNGFTNGHSEPKNEELQVLVIGGGQNGLSFAAHLEHMGLRYLLVEKNLRIGDSWRMRYDTLKTHTPTAMDSLPFLRYPTNWPRNMTKDQYGDWMESYSKILNLKVECRTTVHHVVRDELQRNYIVELETMGMTYAIRAKHVVLSTGLHSDQPIQLNIPGQNSFRGEIYHSSQHKSAANVSNLANKSVTIVGAGTSAHDIAYDFVAHGAKSVSMIQRNPNIFVSLDSLEQVILNLWMTPHMTTEDKDLVETSMPNALALTMAAGTTAICAQLDKELIEGMEDAGLALRKGEDGIGLLDHLIVKSGHFYVDHGAAQMIVDGRIKIHRFKKGLSAFYDHGLELVGGTKLESDVVVLATGWERNGNVVERILGKDIADKVHAQEWGYLDEESERKGWWRPTGVPGLWCMSGAISWSRQYSRVLALQIAAVEKGYNDQHYVS